MTIKPANKINNTGKLETQTGIKEDFVEYHFLH